ncbi:glycosyltransferase family 4 protein [Candidatus Dependentiae bacterium]|nr:glycosyltransferase family 4 protein [Candidatus Dependentiae bacterium]
MKIAFDIRMINNSGIGTFINGLLYGFSKLNIDSEFILLGDRNLSGLIPQDLNFKLLHFNKPIYKIYSQLLYPSGIDYDIFHYPHYNYPLKLKKNLIVHIHDIAHFHFPSSGLHKSYITYFLKKIRNNNITIITASEFVKNELVSIFNFNPENINVIHHAVNCFFEKKPSQEEINIFKKNNQITGKYILTVGLNKAHKNIKFLIELMTDTKLSEYKLLISTPKESDINDLAILAKKLNVLSRIIFYSPKTVREMPLLYSGADLYIFPSLYEGFGLTPLEAMYFGIPVISSGAYPMPEILGDSALYFNPSELSSCLDAFTKINSNGEIRNKYILNGVKKSREYTWQNAAKKIYNIYEKTYKK